MQYSSLSFCWWKEGEPGGGRVVWGTEPLHYRAQLEILPHCGWTTCLCLGGHLKLFELLAVLSHGFRCLTSALGRAPLDHLLLHSDAQRWAKITLMPSVYHLFLWPEKRSMKAIRFPRLSREHVLLSVPKEVPWRFVKQGLQ